ncbi:2-phospho-L-lactate guanylyltransferase [Cumulibacter soli]|uniref:2-phospho-L-lactate guanylyltransferase n=1 Tax=Cumulibacter soli TaxID=2546344 RepID=UPI001ABA1E29|nr:2-phospho-L-lactate guanylyltransferase [Cumulibacter soli]
MTTHEAIRWHVVVPVKARSASKTRLSPDARRAQLALAFALDTFHAVLGCASVASLIVVTDDDDVRIRARELGARVISELDDPQVRGFDRLNAALRYGVEQTGINAAPTAALTADLPALRPAELERALRAAAAHQRAFVPDHEGTGTSMLTALRGADLAPQFGIASAEAHRNSGAAELNLTDVPGLRLDVDWQHDLQAVRRLGCGAATSAILEAQRSEC